MIHSVINPLIYESEVLELTGLAKATIQDRMCRKRFPKKLFWCRKYGLVWNRDEVYNALRHQNPVDILTEGFHEA